MTIYVFGNPLVKGDDEVYPLAERLKKLFPNLVFKIADPNENFPPSGERNPIILDAVMGIRDVSLISFTDLQTIEKSPISPHDYDLLLHLLLLKKMGKIDSVTVIGIPMEQATENTLNGVSRLISSLL